MTYDPPASPAPPPSPLRLCAALPRLPHWRAPGAVGGAVTIAEHVNCAANLCLILAVSYRAAKIFGAADENGISYWYQVRVLTSLGTWLLLSIAAEKLRLGLERCAAAAEKADERSWARCEKWHSKAVWHGWAAASAEKRTALRLVK